VIQSEEQCLGLPREIAYEDRIDHVKISIGRVQGLVEEELVAKSQCEKVAGVGCLDL
jgi:hypothetical protein